MSAFLCSLLTTVLVGAGGGPKYMDTIVQDDAQLLHRPAAQVRQATERMAALGVDRVRITASWGALTAKPRSRRVPPAPFDASDSRTYPSGVFAHLDVAVKAVTERGMAPMIDLAFWAPRWATGRAASNPARQRWWVDAHAFGDFATAVARRYSGAFPDPDGKGTLPAVRMFTTWNEPNHPSFLAPQWVRTPSGGFRPESPHIYRAMHNAAYDAIKRVSSLDKVLVGGTASTGSVTPGQGGVPPLQFVRALACVDDAMRPLRVPECRGFSPIKADGFAHHPYSRYVTPGTSDPFGDDAPIADVDRLAALLNTLTAHGRIASKLPIYDTEYGYESSQDDPFQPFSREQQGRFLGWATYLAWRQPDTHAFAQFLLRDIDPRESGRRRGTRSYYRDFQTGLYAADGSPKPALQAFKLPFWAQTAGSGATRSVLLFGQVRPGSGAQTVRVERREANGGWTPIRTYGPSCSTDEQSFLTDKAGFFLRAAPFSGATTYRMGWQRTDGAAWEYGTPVAVAEDGTLPPPV